MQNLPCDMFSFKDEDLGGVIWKAKIPKQDKRKEKDWDNWIYREKWKVESWEKRIE